MTVFLSKIRIISIKCGFSHNRCNKGTSQTKIYKELGLESLKFRSGFRRLCTFFKIKQSGLSSYLYNLIQRSKFISAVRWLFLANIYLVYNFEYYFSTKLSFTNKRYHLHVLEKRLCVLQEVWSINNLQQFIHHFSSFTPQWSKLCFHILYPCICKIL